MELARVSTPKGREGFEGVGSQTHQKKLVIIGFSPFRKKSINSVSCFMICSRLVEEGNILIPFPQQSNP